MRPSRALLLAVGAACFAAPPRPAAAQSVDVARYARLLQMADARRLDTALLADMLARGGRAERAAAARAIGQVHGAALAPRLRALLADPDSAVAANAAFALGLLRDTASVAALAAAVDGPPGVGAEAAWALGSIGAPAWPAITAALTARRVRAPQVTAALLIACAKMRPVPAPVVIPWLAAEDPAVRWAAVYAFARPYAPPGARPVLARTHDADAEVRALVARALARQAAGDSLAPRALPALDSLSRDPAEHVRVNALRALGTYGPPARAAVELALGDPDANVRITAAQALGPVMAGAAGRAAWEAAWRSDTSLMFRRAVLIAAMSDGVVLPAADDDDADAWVHLPDWRYRAAVADAGGASPDVQRVREISLPLARDPDARVRTAAFAAFAPFADSDAGHAWRREFMYFGLADPDAIVRATAIGALSARATAAEAALVLKGYPRGAPDTLNDARLATVALLRSAWANDSARFGDSLRAAIRALPVPPDQLSRDAARGFALLAAWSAAPPPPLPPLAWYEEVVRTLVLPALAGREKSAEIATVRGTITIRFAASEAPLTVENFLTLARAGWFDAVRWHRVVPAFVAQDGDRRGDGNGGPGTILRDELDRLRYARGVVGMALSGPDTGGSQYFITLTPQPHLDAGYTAFARVTAGWDALDATVQGDAITSVRIIE